MDDYHSPPTSYIIEPNFIYTFPTNKEPKKTVLQYLVLVEKNPLAPFLCIKIENK